MSAAAPEQDLKLEPPAPGPTVHLADRTLDDKEGSLSIGEQITLDDKEKSLSVWEQIALGQMEMRRKMVDRILWMFGISNFFVMFLVLIVLILENDLVSNPQLTSYKSFQIITKDVIMALIGATAVQVGTIMYLMSSSLFPGGKDGKPS